MKTDALFTIAPATTGGTFTIREHLDYRWTNELVGFDLPAGAEAAAVLDERGRVLPSQITSASGGPRIHFVVDELPALGARSFTLGAPRETEGDRPQAVFGDGVLELSNGLLSVRVPNGWDASQPAPAPVLGVRRGRGKWIGSGTLALSPNLQLESVTTEVIESGALWVAAVVIYRCKAGEEYRVELRLFHGRSEIEITESSSLLRDSFWEFSLQEGLAPDTGWTHPFMHGLGQPARLHPFAESFAERGSNLGAVQMPAVAHWSARDDYYYYGFCDAAAPGDFIGVAGVNNSIWDYLYANQIDLEVREGGSPFVRLSIKAGHRRWLLMTADANEILAAAPFDANSIHQAVKKYETPLDKVKDYVLEWPDVPAAARPFLLADRAQVDALSAKKDGYAPFQDYVSGLNPDLAGDHTYYHAGTHRLFDDGHWNDPATLYLVAETPEERRKQAAFLKDVVMTGLIHRRDGLLTRMGHMDSDGCCCINLGRGLRPWTALYDFAAAEGAFSPQEQKLAQAIFALWSYKIADADYWPAAALTLRDDHPRSAHRLAWFPNRQNDWSFYNIDNLPHNFHGDIWSAAGCVAMCFPTHPQSRAWLDKTLEFWESELTEWVFPEGAWLESATYTLNSMKDYVLYCRMLARTHVRDYFSDERFQRIFRFLVEALGPHDARIGASSIPVMGDAVYPNTMCYVIGWVAGLAQHEPKFASLLQEAWKKTGSQLMEPGRYGLNFCDFLFIDPQAPGTVLPQLKSKRYHGLGAILRHAHGTPNEINLFIKSGVIYSHFHEPEGTFQLWWDGVPLCDEYGVMYGKGASEPSAHNCVDTCPIPSAYNKGDITTFISNDFFDYVVTEAPIQNLYVPEGGSGWGFKGEAGPAGWHKRHFFLVKPYYLALYDELESPHPSSYHLNIKADGHRDEGNLVHYDGRYGVDLEFLTLEPNPIRHSELDVVQHYVTAFKPPPRFYHQLQLTMEGRPYQDYATVLLPHRREVPASLQANAETGGASLRIGEVLEEAFLFPEIHEVQSDTLTYRGQAGAIREDADALVLLQARGTRIGKSGSLQIDGEGPFVATLENDQLTLNTQGVARWLVIGGAGFTSARCEGRELTLDRLGDGCVRLAVPAGDHELQLC